MTLPALPRFRPGLRSPGAFARLSYSYLLHAYLAGISGSPIRHSTRAIPEFKEENQPEMGKCQESEQAISPLRLNRFQSSLKRCFCTPLHGHQSVL